jgi:biopolymer transport protein ExbD
MGATIDNHNPKGSVDVHLNIVPFIDLMSCLTAFLLVTAVWSQLASIDVQTRGSQDSCGNSCDEKVQLSVHVTEQGIWVGLSRINSFARIERADGAYDWDALYSVLRDHKASRYFEDNSYIEIAADNDVPYQTMISTMDTALAAGFASLGVLEPGQLSARAQL